MENQICQDQFGRHYLNGGNQRHCYTLFLKLPDDKRGWYSEELDVLAGTPGEAKRIGKIVLEADYVPELRISKITQSW